MTFLNIHENIRHIPYRNLLWLVGCVFVCVRVRVHGRVLSIELRALCCVCALVRCACVRVRSCVDYCSLNSKPLLATAFVRFADVVRTSVCGMVAHVLEFNVQLIGRTTVSIEVLE